MQETMFEHWDEIAAVCVTGLQHQVRLAGVKQLHVHAC
jgi:hypothetical protein